MRKERICALAALVAVAMVSEPVLARGGGRGGSHGGGHYSSSHSSYSHSSSSGSSSSRPKSSGTGRAVASVVKAASKPEPKQKTSTATARRNDPSNDAAPAQAASGQGGAARAADCLPSKPVFDAKRGECVERL